MMSDLLPTGSWFKGRPWAEKLFQPQRIFLVLGALFGLIWLAITPPFQAPDENLHFCRAYQISEGHLLPVKHQGVTGDSLPKSVIETMEKVNPGLKFHSKDQRQDLEKLKFYLRLPLNPKDRIFYAFPTSSVYPPTAYLPQIAGISAGKWLGMSPLWIMYLGRLCNLVFWLALIYGALRILPGGRWLFAVVALMPMNIFLSSSLSQDGVINSLIYFFLAYLLYLSGQEGWVTRKQLAIIFLLGFCISFSKPFFAVFGFLFLLLPKNKFSRPRTYYLTLTGLMALCYGVTLVWNHLAVIDMDWNKPWASFADQLAMLKSDPLVFLSAVFRSLWLFKAFYIRSHIGQLGWLDTVLPFYTVILPFILILVSVAFLENGLNLKVRHKVLLALIAAAVIGQTLLSLYLVCSPVGAPYVHAFSGRYLLAVAPLFWLLWHQHRWRPFKRGESLWHGCVALVMLFSLVQTTFVLWGRYYS